MEKENYCIFHYFQNLKKIHTSKPDTGEEEEEGEEEGIDHDSMKKDNL